MQSVERHQLALHLQRRRTAADSHHLDGILADDQYLFIFSKVEGQQRLLGFLVLRREVGERTVLQQHNAFAGNLPGCGIVVVGTEEALCAVGVHRRAEVQTQHATHLLIKCLHQVGLALACGFIDEFLVRLGQIVAVVGICAAHRQTVGPRAELHIESVEDGLLGVVTAAPVAHDDTVEAPVAFQDAVQRDFIMAVVLVVVEVVGTHDAPRLAFGDSSAEGRQVDLVKSAVANHHVYLMAILFVVVQTIVLHTRSHALRLQALHVGHYHPTGQPGVFTHVLEVAAAQRRAIDVHTRAQNHVLAAIACLFAQTLAVEACQVGIPSGSQTRQCREGYARVVGLSSLHPLVPKYVGAHAVRSVVGPEVGHSQSGNACCRELRLCVDDANLLVERHARECIVDALLDVFRLVEVDGQRVPALSG